MSITKKAPPHGNFRWLCLTFLAFLLALGASWIIWMSLNFGYKFLYSAIDIKQHITQYAPKNVFKAGFELTTDTERYRLFADIVTAIHQQGIGLAAMIYKDANGQALSTLLTQDEVVHLQDVAILIDRMKQALMVTAALFLGLFAWLYGTRQVMPSFKRLLLSVLLSLFVITGVILAIGAHRVFYQLHIWVFPEEHKWFFYYEESLMSTLMKAPDLFAYIAVFLVVLAIPIFVFMMWLLRQLFVKRMASHA